MNHETISDDLLLSYLHHELAAYERLHVEQWLDASPDNRARLEAVEALWMKLALPDRVPDEWDVDKAWTKVSQRVDDALRTKQRHKALTRRLLWLTVPIAAVLSLIIIYRGLVDPAPETIYLSAGTEQLTDTLPDGSVVMLAPGSRLWYGANMNEFRRDVGLSGEAFFSVVHDSVHPFTVKTAIGLVKVLGTKFIVRTSADTSLFVSVDEGLVALEPDHQRQGSAAAHIGAGEAGIVTRTHPEPRPAVPAPPAEFFGYTGIVSFNDEPLTSVAATLSLTHGIVLRFNLSTIERMRLTATFSHQPPDEIVAVVAATLDLVVESHGNKTYTLKPAGGE